MSIDDTLPGPSTSDASPPKLPVIGSYELGALIGRGGMGEVVNAHDRKIGRDVAIKRLRAATPSPEEVARFLREAQIQARLEHPAIVPVHELGEDEDGHPYFTMKRLTGVTLAEQLEKGDSLQALLRAFADVCLAIGLAHSRGVIHRDLKPANIMLGEFGAVYVIDWGLARVLADEPEFGESLRLTRDDADTRADDILGTPGYMAPEQVRSAARVQRPADVYALGAILFEILAGESLYANSQQALAVAMEMEESVETSAARRRPDRAVPPELDALCSQALSRDPRARPTAPEVARRVQAYLDGDRDLAHRHALADLELANARAALAANRREDAMRAAARALAFAPEAGAAELVSRIMLEPPVEQSPGLQAALRDSDADALGRHARSSAYGYLAMVLLLPVVVWNGVRDWSTIVTIVALSLVLGLGALALRRWPHRRPAEMIAYFFANAVLLPFVGRLGGPLIIAPGVACLIVWGALMYPPLARHPWLVFLTSLAFWLVPVALERAGLLASTWSIDGTTIASTSTAIVVDGTPTAAVLFGANVLIIGVAAFHGATLSRANLAAQRQLVAQAWHLKHLLPDR